MIALRYQRSSMAIFGDLARCGPTLAAKNGSAMRLSLIGIVKPASNYTLKANTALQLASGGKTNGASFRLGWRLVLTVSRCPFESVWLALAKAQSVRQLEARL